MKLDGFDILEQLGHGGMATVYRARQRSLDREVAIKVFEPRFEPTPEDREQFQNEARVAARLKHPGLVQVYDAVFTGETYCFVMELVRGYTVGAWCERKGHLAESQVLDIADNVAAALDYAWTQHGVIHCDIKPDNLMVDADGTVKILDLGLCKTAQSLLGRSETEDQVYGTPQYLSPEQAIGQSDLDCRTDIYALGATLYHLATGQMLFPGKSDAEAMDMQVRAKAPNPRTVNPDLSPAFAALLEKMLAKDRDRRQKDWHEVRTDIQAVRLGLPLPSGAPLPGASTVESGPMPDAPAPAKGRVAAPRKKTFLRKPVVPPAGPVGEPGPLPPVPPAQTKPRLPAALVVGLITGLVAIFLAAVSSHAQKQRQASARQAAIAEARAAANRLDPAKPDIPSLDKAIALFQSAKDKFPELRAEADSAILDLRQRREIAVANRLRARFDSLRNEASALARAGDFDRAVALVLDYAGEGASEFADERRRLADQLLEDQRRAAAEAARREEEERQAAERAAAEQRRTAITDSIAEKILAAFEEKGVNYAAVVLDEQLESHPEAFESPGTCASLRELLHGAKAAQERFDQTFRPDAVLSLRLRNGTSLRGRLLRIDRANDALVFVTSMNGIELNRSVLYKELDPREILSRLGNDTDPGTRLVRVQFFRRFDLPLPSPAFLDDQCQDFPPRIRAVLLGR